MRWIGLLFLLTGCAAQPQLVFQSGFEGDARVEPLNKEAATLLSPGFAVEHIVGSEWDKGMDGRFYIEYTGGDEAQRYARIVPEPGRPDNHVLKFWLGDSWAASEGQRKARVQTSMYGIQPGYREFHYSVRVFLHPDFKLLENYPRPISWLTIAEYWNNEWWVKNEPYGFRVTLGLGKRSAASGPLRFILNAEDAGQKEIWQATASEVDVPLGRWFTLDCHYKEGDANSGRYALYITPEGGKRQQVFDVRGATHNTHDPKPDGVTGFNPMKLYTSKELVGYMKAQGSALQVYWDDFRIWKDE